MRDPTPKTLPDINLALGELEAFASALLPVLLALMLARVARQHAQLLQLRAQLRR